MDVFAPRDPRAATRALTVVIVVSAAVLAGYTAVSPPAGVVLALVVGVVVLLLAGALGLVLAPDRVPPWVHGAAPAAGVVVVACLDVATRDASTAAQVFFLLPVVYVAAHLGRAAAWGLTALAMAGEAVVTGLLLTPTAAVTDTVYLTAVAVTTTALLVRANRRTDELLAELRHLAAVDPLTGLVTRRVLDDAAACALTSADTDAGTSFVLVDVDRFKSVNDSFGHPAGDQVLCHVGEQLVAVVGAGAVVSRLGGDELAVLLPSTPVEVARECAEAALARLRAHALHLEDGRRVTVSASIGVAHAPVHARDLAGLYRAADAALYEAKRGGRDRVAVAAG
ncbi:GGDEF domain-containing protein, partial [Aquipuribacter hungaricus]